MFQWCWCPSGEGEERKTTKQCSSGGQQHCSQSGVGVHMHLCFLISTLTSSACPISPCHCVYDVTGDLRQAHALGWHRAPGVSSSGPGNPVGSAHSEQRKMERGSWRVAVSIRLMSNYRPMSRSVCSAVTARLLLPCGGTRWPLIKRPWAKI